MLEFSGAFRLAGVPWPEEWGRPWSGAGREVMAGQRGVCAVQAGPCAHLPLGLRGEGTGCWGGSEAPGLRGNPPHQLWG